ncbi:hypothetical protein PTKU46_54900 [Paraburkholderia terrae]
MLRFALPGNHDAGGPDAQRGLRNAPIASMVYVKGGDVTVRRRLMNTQTVRAGAHIEGIHWVAEYAETMHEIRIFREGQEVDVHNAPSTLFGDEENAGSKSCADHRAAEAAVLAYLRHFVAEHDAEE